jgi:hypothetical protein
MKNIECMMNRVGIRLDYKYVTYQSDPESGFSRLNLKLDDIGTELDYRCNPI